MNSVNFNKMVVIAGLVVGLFFGCVQAEQEIVSVPNTQDDVVLSQVAANMENFTQEETACEKPTQVAICEEVLTEDENKGISFAFVVSPDPVQAYTFVEEVVETVSQPIIEEVIEEFDEIVEIEIDEEFEELLDDFDFDDFKNIKSIEDAEGLSFWTKIKLGLMLGKIKLIRAKDTTVEHVASHKEKYLIGAFLCACLSTGIIVYLVKSRPSSSE